MSEAGKFDRQVTLQVNTPAADTFGSAGTDAWANVVTDATPWAAIEAVGGSENFQGDRVHAEATHLIRLRYRSDLTPAHRVTFGARTFDILRVFEGHRRDRETHLVVKERV